MKVTMLKTKHYQKDRYTRYRYDAGKSFYLPNRLAEQYIADGVAATEEQYKKMTKKKAKS